MYISMAIIFSKELTDFVNKKGKSVENNHKEIFSMEIFVCLFGLYTRNDIFSHVSFDNL